MIYTGPSRAATSAGRNEREIALVGVGWESEPFGELGGAK